MIPKPTERTGRLVRVSAQSLLVDVGDCLGSFVPACDVSSLCAGDFVSLSLHGETESSCRVVDNVALLARPEGVGEGFPSLNGDYLRINRDRRRQLLVQRANILAEIRCHFAERNFLEIEAPIVVPSPGLELHLQGFSVSDATGGVARKYLITSPEYQLKRLLCAGFQRVFGLGKVFRSGEAGPWHNPEFTMLEWYRAYEGWEEVAQDVATLCNRLATSLYGDPCFVRHIDGKPHLVDLSLPWKTQTVREVVREHAGIDLRGDETVEELLSKMREAGLRIPQPTRTSESGEPIFAWDDLFFSVFLDHVEPKLATVDAVDRKDSQGVVRPVIVCEWPAPLCALARKKNGNPAVVERFEAYVGGLELCNGFGELCDPREQRDRFVRDVAERQKRGLPEYPIDERFLDALREGMPPSGGVALGVDRLLMLLLDVSHIRDVLPFAFDEL
ncbi:MAG TPA: EF-P lysine aminoacylase EpmA [Pseudomonadota bacterium]|nr:EF-P lysine aminoacylase EpmA [Pseudomonadota bacterium]